jgi:cytochrome b
MLADGHEFLAWIVAGLALVHIAGVVTTGRRQGENLVASMIVGSK